MAFQGVNRRADAFVFSIKLIILMRNYRELRPTFEHRTDQIAEGMEKNGNGNWFVTASSLL
jgi:hypothetical protein